MEKLQNYLIGVGVVLITISLIIFYFVYSPILLLELKYLFNKSSTDIQVLGKNEKIEKKNVIKPVDENFGIIIPKIGANSKIIADVNPYDSAEYQRALTRGVAHAKGSAYPGQFGNVFLFSHSSANFYEVSRYNSIFYLLGKLEKNDEIYIFYHGKKIKYVVKEKKLVESSEISYLSQKGDKHQLTLMTCWPPGTTLKRLIITAEILE